MSSLKKFSELPDAPDLSEMDYIIGVKDNGNGTYTNYKYPAAMFSASAPATVRKVITASETGADLFDEWLDGKEILVLITEGQSYLREVHFTQNGGIITGTEIKFYEGQKVYATT